MRQTLLDRELVRPVTDRPVIRLLPWLHVVTIGGRSIMDRGRDAVLPVVDELRAAFADHRMLIATGPGHPRPPRARRRARSRPADRRARRARLDRGRAERAHHRRAARRGRRLLPAAHERRPPARASTCRPAPAAVSNGYPPYELFEFPPAVGKIPPHRTDTGAFLIADAYGAARMVYVKDVDGIYTRDPRQRTGGRVHPAHQRRRAARDGPRRRCRSTASCSSCMATPST